MPIPDEVKEEIAARFRAKYIQDRTGNDLRDLASYLADLPPEHQDLIAAEYVAMRGIPLAPEPASLDSSRSSRLSEPGDEVIGPYKIIRELGRGGQATVYLAEDLRLRRQVALKVLDSGFTSNRTAFERFRREAAITSKLDHPGICTVHEAGEDRGVLWIAMRYVEGESLARKIASSLEGKGEDDPAAAGPSPDSVTGPRTWGEVTRLLKVFEDAARALHAAHEAGVVHRDIKPGNLIVTKEGDPVILDFGLAQELDGDHPTLTMTGDMMGTPAYMSPEQLTAQRIRLDRRTDVYSLVISLYECLTLRRPFEAPTREGLYKQILTKDPPDLRSANRAISSDLKVVVETALEKDRDRRYQTALDLAEELRRVRMREPILAKPVGPLVRLQRWAQRNPGLATALGGLFAVLVAGLAVALFLLGQRDRALGEKNTALTEKTAALTDYDRLGDFSRLQKLVAEADKLWPAEPSKVAALNSWVEQASDLATRLAGHREVRDRLRTSAGLLPYTEADRAADLRDHAADQEQVGRLRRQREETAAALALVESRPPESRTVADPGSPSWLPHLHAEISRLDAKIERLDAQLNERTWNFESSADQFKQDTTAKLVADLTAFVDPDPNKGVLANMRGRLAFAESVERETLVKHQDAWKRATESIATNPKYHGLSIKPQLGLIPIDQDPKSGLWEFVDIQTVAPGTAPIPERGPNGRLVVTEDMGIVFVLLPGGTFRMGAMREPPDEDTAMDAPNVDPEASPSEGPVMEVTLEPFFLSKYEMTKGQWLRVVGKDPSAYGAGDIFGGKIVDLRNPVEQVSSSDCDLWIGRLGLIVPTEAQWEYGARGNTTTPRWTGLGTDGLARAENLSDQFLKKSVKESGDPDPLNDKYEPWTDGHMVHAPVGSFDPNPFGLHDVLGNVREWCSDWWSRRPQAPRPGDGLRSSSEPLNRMFRGGSFAGTAWSARSANRGATMPGYRNCDIGIRPARSCRLD